ncbi:MAG: GNAT family N-acetyltransferase [Anaerolineae bacterium]|nr:GNAT family N-acetyltransferase [Anaerolineae bacterium]
MIRLMQLEDFTQLQALWEPEDMRYSLEGFQDLLARNPQTCFVYQEGQRILGAACGTYDGRRAMLRSVAVLPEARGRGLGKQLVRAVLVAFQGQGLYAIRLHVMADNAAGIALYESLGFEAHLDVLYMGLNLPTPADSFCC